MQMFSLKALRANKNLTQKEVARALGIGLSTYQSYEQQKTFPDVKLGMKIAEFYEVDFNTIFFG